MNCGRGKIETQLVICEGGTFGFVMLREGITSW